MRALVLVAVAGLLALAGGGCISAEQRQESIETSAKKAGEVAFKATYEASLHAGMTEAAAKEAADKAYKLAYENTRAELEKRLPPAGGGGLGKILLGAFYALVQIGLPMLGGKTA